MMTTTIPSVNPANSGPDIECSAADGVSDREAVNYLPPVTASLLGVLKAYSIDESAHKKHLREKYF